MTRWWRQNNRCTRWTLQWCRQNSSADTSPAVVDQLWRLATKKTVARYRCSEERYRRGRTCHSCQGCGQYRCRGIPSKRIVSSYHAQGCSGPLAVSSETYTVNDKAVCRARALCTDGGFFHKSIYPTWQCVDLGLLWEKMVKIFAAVILCYYS